MTFNEQKRQFWYTFQKSHYRYPPPTPSPARSLCSLAYSYTTVILTGIAKGGAMAHPPPPRLIGELNMKKGDIGIGIIYATSHNLPLIWHLMCEEVILIHEISKISSTMGGGIPPGPLPHPHPPLGRFAPSLWLPVDKSWLHHCHWHS